MMAASPSSRISNPPSVTFSAVALIVLAVWSWGVGGVDMDEFFIPWLDHIRSAGPVGTFAHPFSNYAPSYLYLFAAASPLARVMSNWDVLKLVFFAGHLLLVGAVAHLLRQSGAKYPFRTAALIGLAPSLFANPALIGQCDAYWAAALVMALAAAIGGRQGRMFAWAGLAVGLKLQAAFMGPFFLAFALARRTPVRLWLLAPSAYLATLLPAAMAGWPVGDLLTIYFRQMGWDQVQALNAPNIWEMAQVAGYTLPTTLATTAALAATGAYLWKAQPALRAPNAVATMRWAAICALLLPSLLPHMHERYFFMADVLTLVLASSQSGRWREAACTQAGSCLGILAYFTGEPGFAAIGALPMLAALWLTSRSHETIRIDVHRHAHAARHVHPA